MVLHNDKQRFCILKVSTSLAVQFLSARHSRVQEPQEDILSEEYLTHHHHQSVQDHRVGLNLYRGITRLLDMHVLGKADDRREIKERDNSGVSLVVTASLSFFVILSTTTYLKSLCRSPSISPKPSKKG